MERGINVSSGIVTFLSRKEFTFTALYLDLFCYVQFVVKQDESSLPRVSMGLTVRRKTAKNLAVRRKNERILAVSRKKN